ncbi:MAG: hypothetical protein R2748_04660 [Bryobacterales bacterium]
MSTVEFPSAAAARQETLEALPENDGVFDGLRELYRFRELLLMWTDREIRIRYKQSVLGAAWAILQPLCLMLALTVVFSYFAPMPSDGVPLIDLLVHGAVAVDLLPPPRFPSRCRR